MNGFESALSGLNDFAEATLEHLFVPAMSAGFLMLFVLAVNLLARKWLSSAQMGLLWGLVLVRLAMPFGPASDFSLQNLLLINDQNMAAANSIEGPWRPASVPSEPVRQWGAEEIDRMLTLNATPAQEPDFSTTFVEKFTDALNFLFVCLPLIWFTGALVILMYTLCRHFYLTYRVNQVGCTSEERLLQLWADCRRSVSFPQEVPVVVSDDISQPAVMGVFRPRLLLPVDVAELDENQLRLIMLHELSHLIRRDLWVNWIVFGLRLFYWWNPVYWIAASRFFNLREQSRDAMVLRWLDYQSAENDSHDYPREYGELLLMLAQRPQSVSCWRITLPVSILGFLRNPIRRRSLSNRLKAVHTATRRVHPLQKATVIAALLLFTVSGLTDAKYPSLPEPEPASWSTLPDVEYRRNQSDLGSETLQVYDLTQALKRISETGEMTEAESRNTLKFMIQNQFDLLVSSIQTQQPADQAASKPQFEFGENNHCIVRAAAVWQRELKNLLQAIQVGGLAQVSLETRKIALSTDVSGQAGFEWSSLEAFSSGKRMLTESLPDSEETVLKASAIVEEYYPVRVAVLNQDQERRWIQAAQSDSRSSMQFAPKVTLFNGQKAWLCDQVSRPFVTGLKKQENGELKPVLDLISEGVSCTLRLVFNADRTSIQLSGQIDLSQILEINFFTSKIEGKENGSSGLLHAFS